MIASLSRLPVTAAALMMVGSSLVCCAPPEPADEAAERVDHEQGSSSRGQGSSSGAERDGGASSVVLPPTFIRGTYPLPIPADAPYEELHELDCQGDSPTTMRTSYFPVLKEDLMRLGDLLIRYYSLTVGPNGLEDPGTGLGNSFAPLAGAQNTYAEGRTSLQRFEFLGVPFGMNTVPYHLSLTADNQSITGFYEGASQIHPELVTPIRSCAFKRLSRVLEIGRAHV